MPEAPPFAKGDKPNSVAGTFIPVDDHFSHPASKPDARPVQAADATSTRRLSRAANGPEPDRLPGLLLCLAPHGVFRAPELARRAVGSYPAFSPLPASRCRQAGGLLFCDTFRRPRLGPEAPACSTRHVALRCSDFPPSRKSGQRSSIVRSKRSTKERHAERHFFFSGSLSTLN